jgi:hypothetical protein
MTNNTLSTLVEDEHQIASLLIRSGHARDSDEERALREEGEVRLEMA